MAIGIPSHEPFRAVEADQWTQSFSLDFSGGLVTSKPQLSLSDNQFVDIENWMYDDLGNLICRPGFEIFSILESSNTSNIYSEKTIREFFIDRRENYFTFYLADSISDKLTIRKVSDANREWVEYPALPEFSSSVQIIPFGNQNFQDILIYYDGGVPKRINTDGTMSDLGLEKPTIEPVGTQEVVSITDEAVNSADSDLGLGIQYEGKYYYKLTHYYDDPNSTRYGESSGMEDTYSHTISSLTRDEDSNVPEAVKVKFDGLFTSIAPPEGVIRVNVYRSPPNREEGPFRFVGSFDPTEEEYEETSEWFDTVAVNAEGAEIPIGFDDPIAMKYAKKIGPYVFGFDAADDSKLVWSNPGQVDVMPALNFAYLVGEGRGIIEFRKNIYIFTTQGIWAILDSNPNNPPVKMSEVGCAAHDTICDIKTGIQWLGYDNVYWANFNSESKEGDLPFEAGDQIKDQVLKISSDRINLSTACFFDGNYYLSVPFGGGSNNDKTFVQYINTRSWSTTDYAASRLRTDQQFLYHSNPIIKDESKYYIYQHKAHRSVDSISITETNIPIPTKIKSKPLLFDHEFSDIIMNSISVLSSNTGNVGSLKLIFPKHLPAAITLPLGGESLNEDLPDLLWAEPATDSDGVLIDTDSDWNETQWYGASPQANQVHKKLGKNLKGKSVQMEFTVADSGTLVLVLISLYYRQKRPPA